MNVRNELIQQLLLRSNTGGKYHALGAIFLPEGATLELWAKTVAGTGHMPVRHCELLFLVFCPSESQRPRLLNTMVPCDEAPVGEFELQFGRIGRQLAENPYDRERVLTTLRGESDPLPLINELFRKVGRTKPIEELTPFAAQMLSHRFRDQREAAATQSQSA